MCPVSVCHQVSTIGHRSWPMTSRYHIHASGLIGSPTVPSRRRLSSLCFLRPLLAPLDEGANGRGRGVKDIHLVAVDDAPEAVGLREVGRALVHQAGGAVLQRSVNDVAVPGNPADVGGAPVSVFFLEIENPFRGDDRCRRNSRRWCAPRLSACRWFPRCKGCKGDARRRAARLDSRRRRIPSVHATSDRVRAAC